MRRAFLDCRVIPYPGPVRNPQMRRNFRVRPLPRMESVWRKKDPEPDDPAEPSVPSSGDPFADFLDAWGSDPQRSLPFLRSALRGAPAYDPAVDVLEQSDRVTVFIDVPGVAPEQIAVEFGEARLVVRGWRAGLPEPGGSRLRRAERPAGVFFKSVPLPRLLDVGRASVTIDRGVMILTVPRAGR